MAKNEKEYRELLALRNALVCRDAADEEYRKAKKRLDSFTFTYDPPESIKVNSYTKRMIEIFEAPTVNFEKEKAAKRDKWLNFFKNLFLVIAAAGFVLGSIIEVGDARFNLHLIDERQTDLAHIFAYFRYWGKVTLASLLRAVYIFLWSLLFIIPGIIASYSYAMVPYLMAETPTLTAGEAVTRSKEMMNGNRFRLFWLFIF